MAEDQPVAIVTGGGSGIGRQTTRLLAEKVWRIAIVGRTESRLAETVSEAGGTVYALPADITVEGDVERIVHEVDSKWGRIDALVNNAGKAETCPVTRVTPELFLDLVRINALGPMLLVKHVWPLFKRGEGGRVVNVTTMGVFDPFPSLGVYGAAKAALDSLTRSVINEAKQKKMDVKAWSVAPGAVETDMLRGMFSKDMLPENQTLDPAKVAGIIVECLTGERDDESGGAIKVPSH